MNRKEFLKRVWKRLFRPIIILAVIFFCAKFLISVLNENGTERFLTVIILSLSLLFALAYFIGEFLNKIRERIYNKLSNRTKLRLQIVKEIGDYLAVLILGAVLYKFWITDAILASIFIVLLLIERIIQIIKEEKTKFAS